MTSHWLLLFCVITPFYITALKLRPPKQLRRKVDHRGIFPPTSRGVNFDENILDFAHEEQIMI